MSSQHIRPLLSAYLDNEVTSVERRQVDDHLARCADCAAVLAEYRSIGSDIRSMPRPVPPVTLHRDVWTAIEARRHQPAWASGLAGMLRVGAVGTVLAAVVIAALFILRPQPQYGVAMRYPVNGQTNVPINAQIILQFQPAVPSNAWQAIDMGSAAVADNTQYSWTDGKDGEELVLSPKSGIWNSMTTYTITINAPLYSKDGSVVVVKDKTTFSFTTGTEVATPTPTATATATDTDTPTPVPPTETAIPPTEVPPPTEAPAPTIAVPTVGPPPPGTPILPPVTVTAGPPPPTQAVPTTEPTHEPSPTTPPAPETVTPLPPTVAPTHEPSATPVPPTPAPSATPTSLPTSEPSATPTLPLPVATDTPGPILPHPTPPLTPVPSGTASPASPTPSPAAGTPGPPPPEPTATPGGVSGCNVPVRRGFGLIYNDPSASLRSALGCPTAAEGTVALAAEQSFQYGYMFWQGDNSQIYVFNDDNTWQRYPDTWTDGSPPGEVLTPPPSLYQPVRGFGKLWLENASVRAALGWGTNQEHTIQAVWQPFQHGAMLWTESHLIRVLYDNGTWTLTYDTYQGP